MDEKRRKHADYMRAYVQRPEQRGKNIARAKAYYWNNKERMNARSRARRENNRAAYLLNEKRYRDTHKEIVAARIRSAQAKMTPEQKARHRLRHSEWKKENRGRVAAHAQSRRARLLSTVVNDELIRDWFAKQKSRRTISCYWCRAKSAGSKCHIDHITPLAKGGAHRIDNLCVSCAPCNQKKTDFDLSTWNTKIVSPTLAL